MQIKKTNFQDKEYLFTNSFKPNLTSKLISDAIKCVDIKDKDILDLGCGCGALGLSLIEKKPKSILLADISKGAIDDCYSNINKHILRIKNINVEALLSDCFNNISPKKKI